MKDTNGVDITIGSRVVLAVNSRIATGRVTRISPRNDRIASLVRDKELSKHWHEYYRNNNWINSFTPEDVAYWVRVELDNGKKKKLGSTRDRLLVIGE